MEALFDRRLLLGVLGALGGPLVGHLVVVSGGVVALFGHRGSLVVHYRGRCGPGPPGW